MQEMVNVGTPKCVICGNTGIVQVPKEGVARYRAGAAIQVAFPTLDADQRELLMTGTHAHCWEILTGGEDDA